MIYSFYTKILLFFILFLISICLLKFFLDKPGIKITDWRSYAVLSLLFGLIVVIRLIYLRNTETDVDTSTWLSSVITFKHSSSKLWTLLNYTDSRPLTVLPLIAGLFLGFQPDYPDSEIIGLILWILSTYFIFRICGLFMSFSMSLLVTWSMGIFLATIWSGFAAYNSEHISVFPLTAALFGYVAYVFEKWDKAMISLAIGILLGSVVYAKFQNVPMGMIIGLFLMIEMAKRKNWKHFIFLLTGAFLPTILINTYYFSLDKLSVFWNNYFWNNYYYSYTNQFSNTAITERFSLYRMLSFIIHHSNSGYYILTLGCLIMIGLVFNYKSLLSKSAKKPGLILFAVLYLISSIYAVLQSGNDFEHYKLYLFVPLIFLTTLMMAISSVSVQKYMAVLLVIGSLSQTARNIEELSDMSDYSVNSTLDDKVSQSIQTHSRSSDRIVIWGWCDRLFVKSQRAMGFRDAHVFHFSLKSPLIPSWTKDFLFDMESNKPRLFIEAMIPVYSERGDIFLSHDRVPVIRAYIAQHYTLIDQVDGIKIFRRR